MNEPQTQICNASANYKTKEKMIDFVQRESQSTDDLLRYFEDNVDIEQKHSKDKRR